MNILITGASGLLGLELVEYLAPNHQIHALVHKEPKNPVKNVIYHNIDLSANENFSFHQLPNDIDIIYHLAQSSLFRDFPETALDIFNVNIKSTAYLLDYAYKSKVKRFIYASSGGIYGSSNAAFNENLPINICQDLGYYLGSKLCGEILCQNYNNQMDISIVRFFFLYGKSQKRTMLLPRLVDSIREGKSILLMGNNGIKINPVHVSDAVKCLEKILKSKGCYTMNIAGTEIYSLRNICQIIAKNVGKHPIFEISKGIPNDLIADISFMKKNFYTPNISLDVGIKDLL